MAKTFTPTKQSLLNDQDRLETRRAVIASQRMAALRDERRRNPVAIEQRTDDFASIINQNASNLSSSQMAALQGRLTRGFDPADGRFSERPLSAIDSDITAQRAHITQTQQDRIENLQNRMNGRSANDLLAQRAGIELTESKSRLNDSQGFAAETTSASSMLNAQSAAEQVGNQLELGRRAADLGDRVQAASEVTNLKKLEIEQEANLSNAIASQARNKTSHLEKTIEAQKEALAAKNQESRSLRDQVSDDAKVDKTFDVKTGNPLIENNKIIDLPREQGVRLMGTIQNNLVSQMQEELSGSLETTLLSDEVKDVIRELTGSSSPTTAQVRKALEDLRSSDLPERRAIASSIYAEAFSAAGWDIEGLNLE